MITSNDVTHGKPHPEPYSKAAALLGFSPSDCIVLEDAPAGIKAGKAAGARVIAFTTTVQSSEVRRAGADWILNNCSDIRVMDAEKGLSLDLTENKLADT
jgi:beta-phosphoglucomutase-like phosphatase (HAD superfamily)